MSKCYPRSSDINIHIGNFSLNHSYQTLLFCFIYFRLLRTSNKPNILAMFSIAFRENTDRTGTVAKLHIEIEQNRDPNQLEDIVIEMLTSETNLEPLTTHDIVTPVSGNPI